MLQEAFQLPVFFNRCSGSKSISGGLVALQLDRAVVEQASMTPLAR